MAEKKLPFICAVFGEETPGYVVGCYTEYAQVRKVEQNFIERAAVESRHMVGDAEMG